MTNLIKVIYATGKTIKYQVFYDNNGTIAARAAAVTMAEEPVGSGVYKGSPTLIVAGDIVVITEGSNIISGDEYHVNIALESAVADDNPDGSSIDTTFTLTDGSGNNDEYNNMVISVIDVSGGVVASRRVIDYTGANKKVETDAAFEFPIAIGDKVRIWADTYSQTAGAAAITDIATAVWNRQQALHRDVGTTGRKQSSIKGGFYT